MNTVDYACCPASSDQLKNKQITQIFAQRRNNNCSQVWSEATIDANSLFIKEKIDLNLHQLWMCDKMCANNKIEKNINNLSQF